MEPYNYNIPDQKREQSRPKKYYSKRWIWLIVIALTIWFIIDLISRKEMKLDEEEIAKLDNDLTISPIFKAFYKCLKPKLLPYKENYKDFWYKFTKLASKCNKLKAYNLLDIRPSMNRDKVKYVALPQKTENLTMVTLGIGHDVGAEMGLKDLYPYIEFFGADPSSEHNKDLYERILGGKYFPYSVSDRNGKDESIVLLRGNYKKEMTQHISIESFFKDIVQKKKIDILWIDVEGNEYAIMNQLHKNKLLDKEGIKICQMNIEFHQALSNISFSEMELFHDFVWKILEDKKYVLMKPSFLDYMSFPKIQLFIVNVFDKECTDLFLK